MKGIKTYAAVIMAVRNATNSINTFTEVIYPLICIANKPLIFYPLDCLCRNDFEEVIIVTSVTWEKDLKVKVDEYLKGRIRVQYIVVNDVDQVVGTGECLKKVCAQETLIKEKDILVMSYDLISRVSFSLLDELHRKTESPLTILLSQKPRLQDVPVPLPKKYKKQEREITVFCEGELVYLAKESTMGGKLNLKPSLLKNACNFEVHSDLIDCHTYLFSHRTLNLLHSQQFESLENDFIPWLINNSHDENIHQTLYPEYKSSIKEDHSNVLKKVGKRFVCQTLVHNNTSEACIRVRNPAAFCAANFMLSKETPHMLINKHKTLTVCSESSVGEGVEVYGRANIRSSVIGNNVSIGCNCRVSNSIVMSHAIIQQNVQIENSVVCGWARISEGTVLKECFVSQGQAINTGKYTSKDTFTA